MLIAYYVNFWPLFIGGVLAIAVIGGLLLALLFHVGQLLFGRRDTPSFARMVWKGFVSIAGLCVCLYSLWMALAGVVAFVQSLF